MLKNLTIAENALDVETWKKFETENILDFLVEYFKTWPDNARLYHNNVSEANDITPQNTRDFENILKLEGNFYVVVYPGEVITWVAIIISIIAIAIVVFTPKPSIPNIAIRSGSENPSSNNELSERTNKPRINARIPDIFGQVRSVPDLIALPYKFFEDNIEKEHSYMCIGKGEFEITDIKEDTTLFSQLKDSSLEIYGPNTSPNSSSTPLTRIGRAINIPIKKVTRLTSVNGQVVDSEDRESIIGINEISFNSDLKIKKAVGSTIDFTSLFANGDTIIIVAYQYEEVWEVILETLDGPVYGWVTRIKYDFSGTYTINTVTASEILIVTPGTVNADWNYLILNSLNSDFIDATLKTVLAGYIGPFTIDRTDNKQIWFNFVALNGLYKDNGTKKTPIPIDLMAFVTPVNEAGTPIGATETFSTTLIWSGVGSLAVGKTLKVIPTFTGRCQVKVKRITPKIIASGYQIYDEVKWRDLYAVSDIAETQFGNVTTVQVISSADSSALNVKERKLNMLATRKIPNRISGTTFSTILYPTKRASEIISFICLDQFIGKRSLSEIDFDNIYSTVTEIETYFGTVKAAEFSYTFDSSNLSFEEIMHSIADSIFCIAYRRGNKIKISFEKLNNNSTILFNHRNKIPGTETRTVSFGNSSDNDGIEYKYIDKTDDSLVSIYVPTDKSAANPSIVESIGVRNYSQAYFHAKRLYNKIKYKNQAVEFEATQESNICIINDRILVSDGTRAGSLEGEIVEQNLLELTLSQNLTLLDGISYTMFLQYKDGSVESIPISKTSYQNKVLLAHAPAMDLVLGYNSFARTTFLVTSNTDNRKTAFILTEKSPKGVMTSELKAINYDARYYQNDKDLINSVITDI